MGISHVCYLLTSDVPPPSQITAVKWGLITRLFLTDTHPRSAITASILGAGLTELQDACLQAGVAVLPPTGLADPTNLCGLPFLSLAGRLISSIPSRVRGTAIMPSCPPSGVKVRAIEFYQRPAYLFSFFVMGPASFELAELGNAWQPSPFPFLT